MTVLDDGGSVWGLGLSVLSCPLLLPRQDLQHLPFDLFQNYRQHYHSHHHYLRHHHRSSTRAFAPRARICFIRLGQSLCEGGATACVVPKGSTGSQRILLGPDASHTVHVPGGDVSLESTQHVRKVRSLLPHSHTTTTTTTNTHIHTHDPLHEDALSSPPPIAPLACEVIITM